MKKVLTFLFAICLILPLGIVLTACGGQKHCFVTVGELPAEVKTVAFTPTQTEDDKEGENRQYFNKNETGKIHIIMEDGYELNNLSNFMFVNGVAVQLQEEPSGSLWDYEYSFTATEDVSLTFNAEAVQKVVIDVSFMIEEASEQEKLEEGYEPNILDDFIILLKDENDENHLTKGNVASAYLGEENKEEFQVEWGEKIEIWIYYSADNDLELPTFGGFASTASVGKNSYDVTLTNEGVLVQTVTMTKDANILLNEFKNFTSSYQLMCSFRGDGENPRLISGMFEQIGEVYSTDFCEKETIEFKFRCSMSIDYIAQDLSFDINGIAVPFEIEDDVLTLTLQKPQSYYEDDSEDKYYYSMQYVIRTNVERLIQEN